MHSRGTSILETIIYIAIFAIISVLTINLILITSSAFGKSRVKRNINEQCIAAMERVIRELRLANDIDIANSQFGTHPGKLQLATVVSATDNTVATKQFFLQGDDLVIKEDAAPAVLLTSGIKITSLIFWNIDTTASESRAISVELTAEDGEGKFKSTQKFYGTAVLRGNY
jgi:hypothetical protein